MKIFMLLLFSVMLPTVANAQNTGKRASSLSRLLMKHTYNGEYELPKLRVETPHPAKRAADASGAPLEFKDRVWFPGEWEEVKAVVVSPLYNYLIPGFETDIRYNASQLLKNWGKLYYQADRNSEVQYLGNGECKAQLDVETDDGFVFLYIMDGIQRAGAQAWVRIEDEADEAIIRDVMTKSGMRTDNMQFFVAPGNAFWFRDCGPICFYYGDDDNLAMLDFFYSPQRPTDDLLPSFLHRKFGIPNYYNDIIWEGGNCLVDGVGGLVTSTAVYQNNADTIGRMWWDGEDFSTIRWNKKYSFSPADVKAALSGLVGQRQTIILPRLNFDGGTGHIDLYADATDENSFLLTQMPETYDSWTDYDIAFGNTTILLNKRSFFKRKYYDGGSIPFPSFNDGSNWQSEEEYGQCAQSYANHLICNNYILQPCFSPVADDGLPTADWDRANIKQMEKLYPGYTFYCIDMRTFNGLGGSIHCVTKQIPADNPVRIIHKNIHGYVNPGTNNYIPFSAIITNKSGIKEAKLFYSVNGGDWNEVDLTANGNRWSCKVNLSALTGGQPLTAKGIDIEYYIQATSNNGKTVSKPLNAQYGAFYNFNLTTNAKYDKDMFDFETAPMLKDSITFQLDARWLVEDTSTDEPTTDITEVKSHVPATNVWYTLGGLRLATHPTAKGIYIFNGKKVVIK